MSYRTYINDTQVFGNNEYYKEWADFLSSKGIEIDEDGLYDGYIDDLQGMFNVIDKITQRLIDERHQKVLKGEKWFDEPMHELTDLSESMWLNKETPLLMYNVQMIRNAYCFLPYQVFKAVENIIERAEKSYVDDYKDWLGCSFKLKDGEKIHVRAS